MPIQCVQKKRGMIVVPNERKKPFPMRQVIGLRVCMNYKKFNAWTKKDHFPMPFMDQILDRLAGKGWHYFFDGYSGYKQISIAPEDKKRPLLLVLIRRLHSSGCLLGCVMHQILFKEV